MSADQNPALGLAQQCLFHAFPRKNTHNEESILRILESILEHGLLCTPEMGHQGPAYGMPRACFTLATGHELSMLRPSLDKHLTHSDIFGHCAIGIAPRVASILGLLPVVYYYERGPKMEAGIGREIADRLQEAIRLLYAMAHIEGAADASSLDGVWVPTPIQLNQQGMTIPSETVQLQASLSAREASRVLGLLESGDRMPSYNIADLLETLLALYQTAASNESAGFSDFYQQREWRLVRHTRKGLIWFCAGSANTLSSPLQKQLQWRADSIASCLSSGRQRNSDYLDRCWVLHMVDGRPFREFIDRIVAPAALHHKVKRLVGNYGLSIEVDAEARPWRLDWNAQPPRIVE